MYDLVEIHFGDTAVRDWLGRAVSQVASDTDMIRYVHVCQLTVSLKEREIRGTHGRPSCENIYIRVDMYIDMYLSGQFSSSTPPS